MSPRYLISVEQGRDAFLASLPIARPSVGHDNAPLEAVRIDAAALPQFDTGDNARLYGSQLYDALCAHPAIQAALEAIYNQKGNAADPSTMLLDLRPPAADAFRWETLFYSNQNFFFAIDAACRLARVKRIRMQPFPLPQTLTLMAFLSPAGVSAEQELAALQGAIDIARGNGLAIQAKVFVGERALLTPRIPPPDWLTLAPIPSTVEDFEQLIRQGMPQFLHFFCHGDAGPGPQVLQFATLNDWDLFDDLRQEGGTAEGDAAEGGTAVFGIPRLLRALAPTPAWLIVLNCCTGGKATPQSQSMASALVAGGACAAAVGMIDPIRDSDATLVTKALYSDLFGTVLRDLHGTPPPWGDVDFTSAIAAARIAFYDRCDLEARAVPGSFGRWSMPVLYLAEDYLTYRMPPPGPTSAPAPPVAADVGAAPGGVPRADVATQGAASVDLARRERLAVFVKALRELPADTPDVVRDKILALCDLDPVIPIELRPDRYGNFAQASMLEAAGG